jgi:CO/xanthine dehydrogenase FAD-binding subunit
VVTFNRRLPNFDYIRPNTLAETLNLLANSNNGTYRVYAGGTDLIPKLKRRAVAQPEVLVDLKGIPNLDYVGCDDQDGLRLGALATIRSVATSPFVSERFPILSQAAGSITSIQIQNRGTIAGNICHAVPSADSAPALLCLGARLLCVSEKGEREIGIEEFFKSPYETALRADEVLEEIQVSPMPDKGHGVYIKLSPRSRMDHAVVGVAVIVVAENEIIRDIRIGLGAVAPTPVRARYAEDMLCGEKVNEEMIAKAARSASEESRPIDDHRASAEYRKMMVEVLVSRAIRRILPGSY